VVARYKDANTAWTAASDGVLEERGYYCQNYHADVVALVGSSGYLWEWVKYSAYGVPFGLPGGDTDSDGDCDSADVTQVQDWIDASAYDVRGDVELDGDVDSTDKSAIQANYEGLSAGRERLGNSGNRMGSQGSSARNEVGALYSSRLRWRSSGVGRWLSRDPLTYVDGWNLYTCFGARPTLLVDPQGTQSALGKALDVGLRLMAEVLEGEKKKACCDAAEANDSGALEGAAGFVACCDGEMITCTKSSEIADYKEEAEETGADKDTVDAAIIAIVECIHAHEGVHIGEGHSECQENADKPHAAGYKSDDPVENNGAEHTASIKEQQCLSFQQDDPDGLCNSPGVDSDKCSEIVDIRIIDVGVYMNQHLPVPKDWEHPGYGYP